MTAVLCLATAILFFDAAQGRMDSGHRQHSLVFLFNGLGLLALSVKEVLS